MVSSWAMVSSTAAAWPWPPMAKKSKYSRRKSVPVSRLFSWRNWKIGPRLYWGAPGRSWWAVEKNKSSTSWGERFTNTSTQSLSYPSLWRTLRLRNTTSPAR